MKNDFFKHILLSSGSKQNRTEFETETLPYTFNSNSYKLRNYRIYGNTVNGESVGDLVTEGEHSGEYLVPVKVERKNLLQNTATSQTINGVTFTVNADGSVTCNTDENGATEKTRFYLVGSGGNDFTKLNIKANAIITGCPPGGSANTYAIYILRKNDDMEANQYNTWAETGNGFNLLYNETNKYVIFISISAGVICNNLTFYPMIRLASIADDTYEPYQTPITTNLYLPEQIKMVGDEAEYVDYKEQKQYFADGTSTNVTLPALPTLSGTNTLSVGTTVQPSKIYLQGKISKAEIVSAEPVQANVQSLQPFSLDFMPIDRSEFQINDSLTEWNVATASAESEAET